MHYSTLQEAEEDSQPIILRGRFLCVRLFTTAAVPHHICYPVPAGAASHWPACKRWQRHTGVLRMTELAGKAQVQVLTSTEEEPLFFGDMRQYMPRTCSFGEYLTACDPATCASTAEVMRTPKAPGQAYLAQASLDQGQPLAALRQDFDIPEAIRHVEINRTNLWMSIG